MKMLTFVLTTSKVKLREIKRLILECYKYYLNDSDTLVGWTFSLPRNDHHINQLIQKSKLKFYLAADPREKRKDCDSQHNFYAW